MAGLNANTVTKSKLRYTGGEKKVGRQNPRHSLSSRTIPSVLKDKIVTTI